MSGGFERWAKTPRPVSPTRDAESITSGVAILRTASSESADC